MIEAVNSVLSSAPLLRQNAEQQSGARSLSVAPGPVQEAIQAPYVDAIRVDLNFDTAVLLLRDGESGDTIQQIPSEGRLASERRAEQAAEQAREFQERIQSTPDTSTRDTGGRNSSVESSERTTTGTTSPAPSESADTTISSSTPVSQNVIAAFAAGQQTASSGTTSNFATSA